MVPFSVLAFSKNLIKFLYDDKNLSAVNITQKTHPM